MTIYVDDARQPGGGRSSALLSHLFAGPGDPLSELHTFANRLGLPRSSFQEPPATRHPHYPVVEGRRKAALTRGAQALTVAQAAKLLQAAQPAETAPPADAPAQASPVAPAAPGSRERASAEHPCPGSCGRLDTRLYAEGHRCPAHSPAARRGHPEPDLKRYCAPFKCYCQDPACPAIYGTPTPALETVLDTRAIASGKRRSSPQAYRAAQEQAQESRERSHAS